jgi:hypothetical protein
VSIGGSSATVLKLWEMKRRLQASGGNREKARMKM